MKEYKNVEDTKYLFPQRVYYLIMQVPYVWSEKW